jgi:MSHA biogenesis protein MshL
MKKTGGYFFRLQDADRRIMRIRERFPLCFLAFLFLFYSCAATPDISPTTASTQIPVTPSVQQPGPPPVSPAVQELPPIMPAAPKPAMDQEAPFDGKLFSFSVRSVPLRDVLIALAKTADLNLVLGQYVDAMQPVSVEFSSLPLKQAMQEVLSTYDYSYTISGSVLKIEALEKRIFHFDYPLIYTKLKSSVGGDMLGASSNSGGTSSGGGSSSGGSSSGGSGNLTASYQIDTESESDESLNVWKKIREALRPGNRGSVGSRGAEGQSGSGKTNGLLSPIGSATIDSASGTIVVFDRPGVLDTVGEFLKSMKASLSRQVVIEAKIIEVQLNHSHQYGVDWSVLRPDSSTPISVTSNLASSLASGTGLFNIELSKFSNNWNINALIDAIGTQGNINTISSPRLNVINNQSATISIGKLIPYLDFQVSTQSITSGGVVSYVATPTVQKAQAGISLGITPQISASGEIILHIVPVITDQVGSQQFTYQSTTWSVPILDTRYASTIVSAENGQTIVLGGMIQDKTADNRTSVPLLSKIPVLGKLFFANQSKTADKTELVIMLTPRIVKL